jgi:hypothetical protein
MGLNAKTSRKLLTIAFITKPKLNVPSAKIVFIYRKTNAKKEMPMDARFTTRTASA